MMKLTIKLIACVGVLLLGGCGDTEIPEGDYTFSERMQLKVLASAFLHGCKNGSKDESPEELEDAHKSCQCAVDRLLVSLDFDQWRRLGNIADDDLSQEDKEIRQEVVDAIQECKRQIAEERLRKDEQQREF